MTSETKETKIPSQLQNENFRFLKIRVKGKEPTADMQRWQERNFKYNDTELLNHLRIGGNYAIIGGFGKLILIDSDSEEINTICEQLPNTFTIKTGSPEEYKKHYYFICDNRLKPIRLSKEGVGDLGDIRSVGQYVVAPTSIHPSGGEYNVVKDIPIATISELTIRVAFGRYIDKTDNAKFRKFPIDTKKRSSDFIRECKVPDYVLNNKMKGATSKNWKLFPYLVDILHSREVPQTVYTTLCKKQGHMIGAIAGWVKKAHEGNLAKTSCEKMQEYLKRFHPELIKTICENCPLYKKRETKPMIENPGTDKLISSYSIKLANILKDKHILFYRPDSKDIVEVRKLRLHNTGKEVYTGFVSILPNRFITLIEKYIVPGIYVYNEKINEMVFRKKSISAVAANTVLSSEMLQHALPQVTRIFTIPIPIFYKGELAFPKKGYDIRFNSWLSYDSPDISSKNMKLKKAKKILYKMLKEFCFETPQDYTNAIAALLTPFLRGLFGSFNTRTPIFFYLGNRERVGKDYLAGCTGIIYEGHSLEETPISSSESRGSSNEELRKKILAAMISGRKRLHFSNNKGYINNATFESVSTAEKWSDRLLGRNEIVTFENELDFSLSGNVGVTFTPDFANRCRFIRLFLNIEDANSRIFENPSLHNWVKKNRELLLSALYVLVKNWIDNGKKSGTVPFTSFPQWANICGGIMEAAGYNSPCVQDKQTLNIGGDRETQDMKQLFEICYEKFPDEWLKKSEIRGIIENDDNNIFSYLEFDKKSGQTAFGMKLTKFIGRTLSDITFVVRDSSKRSSLQEFKFTKDKTYSDRSNIIM